MRHVMQHQHRTTGQMSAAAIFRQPGKLLHLLLVCLLILVTPGAQADDPWQATGADGRPQVKLYFFWLQSCPHCTAAHPYVEAIPQSRPWVKLHAFELSRNEAHVRLYRELAQQLGERGASVPAFLFCGQMQVGWESDETTGVLLRQRLDECHARLLKGLPVTPENRRMQEPGSLPMAGNLDLSHLSLPVLTLVLAGLDAFNPCAFFVLLFLLSMMAHQKSRARMLIVGGVFVLVSGLMYFAFMAAWLNAFQMFGHLAWVTLAAGALALLVGALNVKDYFRFGQGLTLSIPESKKPEVFRRTRAILNAENLPTMLAATLLLAVAANFYELLCTAGFPMIYTRMLTLAEVSPLARYGYLAVYNLIYVLPLALIVVVFARTMGARKLTEREGRLLKLMSGVMMLGLGGVLLFAPELLSRAAVALLLVAVALGIIWLAARSTE